jgi:hypothetical protein
MTQTYDLEGFLKNVKVGSGLEVVYGAAVAPDYVSIGTIGKNSFAHPDPRNHRLDDKTITYMGNPKDVLEAVKTGHKLTLMSHANLDGPLYEWYRVE